MLDTAHPFPDDLPHHRGHKHAITDSSQEKHRSSIALHFSIADDCSDRVRRVTRLKVEIFVVSGHFKDRLVHVLRIQPCRILVRQVHPTVELVPLVNRISLVDLVGAIEEWPFGDPRLAKPVQEVIED